MKILTAEAMRALDRAAIEGLGLPGPVLMENAAIGVVDAIAERFPEAESAAIFCGPGNNGGDGLAIARHLHGRGYAVEVFVAAGGRPLSPDAEAQLEIVRRLGLPLRELDADESPAVVLAVAAGCDLLIDALYGTGLSRSLDGQAAALVEGLNEMSRPRVAVDIPSGLHGSRADVLGPCLQADLTVTFAAPKLAHVFPPAAERSGELVVADLGFPRRLVDAAEGDLHLLTAEELAPLVPERSRASHKGDHGHALLVAGSPGKAGAAILAARAAVRAGAGLVTVAVPEAILQTVALGSIESMTFPLPTLEPVPSLLAGKAVLAIGPGLGQEPETGAAIRRWVLEAPLPVVVDADGLNAFIGCLEDLKLRQDPTILTPHPGELGRLLGKTSAEIQRDRLAAATRAARESGAIVILKGHLTLVATPEGEVHVNPTGNPGMATGGTGDVLTGMLAGWLAQGLGPLDAARLAVFLHGLAGDLAAEDRGEIALAAGDLIENLPAALRQLGE